MPLDPRTLKGQVALVTGCGQPAGIGAEIARTLARAGADVAICDLAASAPRLEELAAEITESGPGRAHPITSDLTDEDSCAHAVRACVDALGGLNILVNNAAAPKGDDRGDVTRIPAEAWSAVLDVNLRGPFFMVKHALPEMRASGSGRIVNIGSLAAVRSFPGRTVYGVSKAGVVGFTTSLAGDLAPEGITVNAVCPGLVRTPRNPARGSTSPQGAPASPQQGDALSSAPLGGRIAEPEDIAGAVAFFVSDLGKYSTGQALYVDGGLGSVMSLG